MSEQLEKNIFELGVNRRIDEARSELQKETDFTRQPAPDADTSDANSQVDNLIDNSDFDFSKDAYLNSPLLGGDVGEEVYNFFRNLLVKVTDVAVTNGSPTASSSSAPFKASYTYPMPFVLYGAGGSAGQTLSGTLTRASDTSATLSTNALATLSGGTMFFGEGLAQTAALAVKATAHSLFAANEGTNANIPRWDKTNGWLEIGANNLVDNYSINAPFALNVIRPGLRIFVLAIVSVRAGAAALADGVRFFFGVWDATAARNRWLEGDNFNLSAQTVGASGSATDVYKAVAVLDDGSEIESNSVTVNNAPNTLSGTNYNRLSWTNAPGILDFKLYRQRSGITYRIFTISNGAGSYNDTGYTETVVSGFPTTGETKAIVYRETTKIFPVEGAWSVIGAYIDIPSTYNTSNTTDRQWFRFGTVSGESLPANRPILLDRLAVSFRSGGWGRSWRYLNLIKNNNPSSLPIYSDQGDAGIRDPYCFEKSTLVCVGKPDGSNRRWIPLEQVEKGMWVWTGSRNQMRRLKKPPKWSKVSQVTLFVLVNGGWFRCTETERFVTSRADKKGTPLSDLTYGDTILGADEKDNIIAPLPIQHFETRGINQNNGEQYDVCTLSFDEGHIFAVGNLTPDGVKWALAHNRKINDYEPMTF